MANHELSAVGRDARTSLGRATTSGSGPGKPVAELDLHRDGALRRFAANANRNARRGDEFGVRGRRRNYVMPIVAYEDPGLGNGRCSFRPVPDARLAAAPARTDTGERSGL